MGITQRESVVFTLKKKKPSALQAWKMLILSLPKGIAAFMMVVAGLSVSLPLSAFLIGLPLLAQTLVLCTRMMDAERWRADVWKEGSTPDAGARAAAKPEAQAWSGWRALLGVLGRGRSYRGILYGLLQLPVGIAAFTAAIVIPVTAWAVMLSPLAYQVSAKVFSFDLFARDWLTTRLLPSWTSYEISWLYAGVGAVFVLLLPIFLRWLGRIYAAWILAVSGMPKVPPTDTPAPDFTTDLQPLPQYNP